MTSYPSSFFPQNICFLSNKEQIISAFLETNCFCRNSTNNTFLNHQNVSFTWFEIWSHYHRLYCFLMNGPQYKWFWNFLVNFLLDWNFFKWKRISNEQFFLEKLHWNRKTYKTYMFNVIFRNVPFCLNWYFNQFLLIYLSHFQDQCGMTTC